MTMTTFYSVEMGLFVTGLQWAGAVVMTIEAGQGARKTLPSCARRRGVPEEPTIVAVLTVKMLVAQEYAKHRLDYA